MSTPCPIHHRIERDGRHELLITTTFSDGCSEVHIPMWRPGRYERGDFGQRIRQMEQLVHGSWVPLSKTALHIWGCHQESAGQKVQVRFRYTACRLDAGNTWSDDSLLYVNPVNLLPHHPALAEQNMEILLADVPNDWSIATALDHKSTTDGRLLLAEGTQHVMDSPWIAAPANDLWHDEYTLDGHTFHVHVWGQRHFDDHAFVQAHAQFTECQLKAFGWLPCSDYHFLYLFPEFQARHGVEHEASTVIAWGPSQQLTYDENGPSPGMEEVIDIASHELVHTWNVKWLRPSEWMPYNFGEPSPSRLGYVAEGVTTYLGDLFLLESGVIDMSGWLRRFEKLLTRHLWNPGRLSTSIADSSFDTWLDGYGLGIPHRRGNIYVEGAVLAFLCDVTLHRSGGGWLIDALAELTGPEQRRDLTEADWWSTLEKRASLQRPEGREDIKRLREEFCEGTGDTWPDLVDALLHQGVQATLEPHQDPIAQCGALCGSGIKGRKEVKISWPGSPAWNAGLRRGDVIEKAELQASTLRIEWLRDAVHSEQSNLAVPSSPGHFPRPSLAAFPG